MLFTPDVSFSSFKHVVLAGPFQAGLPTWYKTLKFFFLFKGGVMCLRAEDSYVKLISLLTLWRERDIKEGRRGIRRKWWVGKWICRTRQEGKKKMNCDYYLRRLPAEGAPETIYIQCFASCSILKSNLKEANLGQGTSWFFFSPLWLNKSDCFHNEAQILWINGKSIITTKMVLNIIEGDFLT